MNMLMHKHKTPSTRKVLVSYRNHYVIRFYLLEQGFSSLLWGNETNILYMFFQHNTLWHDNTWRSLLNTKTTKTFWKEKCQLFTQASIIRLHDQLFKKCTTPFGPICNLSQDKLVVFWEYNDYKNDNPKKGFA